MVVTLPATEARVHFGEMLRRVSEGGERVIVERGGTPRAVLLSIEDYEYLTRHELPSSDWQQLVDESREAYAQAFAWDSLPNIDQVFHEMRKDRDAELLANLR